MNLQSITGTYPSNIGSYTQSLTGVYNTNTEGGGEYTNTDNNIVIDNVSNIINLSTNIITSLTDLSNNKQDNIILIGGNNISISNLNSSWTIEALASGSQVSNTDTNLVINIVSDTINLSQNINLSNINLSTLIIPNNTISEDKITNLNTSLDSLSNNIGSLNTSVSNLSNNKQDNITLVAGTGISISNLIRSWTINSSSSSLAGTNIISVFNSSIHLSTSINVSNINTSTLTIPNNTLSQSKITDLVTNLSSINASITNLNNNKEGNISIVSGNNVPILFDSPNNKWTINAVVANLSVAGSSDNLSILNGSIN